MKKEFMEPEVEVVEFEVSEVEGIATSEDIDNDGWIDNGWH